MEYIRHTTEFVLPSSAVTLGKFEGVHIGHQKLISQILKKRIDGMAPVVFTFDVSPDMLVHSGMKRAGKKTLLTNEERAEFIEGLGVDTLVEYPFTDAFMKMQPEDFIQEILCRRLQAKYIAVGEDFSFGYKRKGNVETLERYSKDNGYVLEVFSKEQSDGKSISSTRIRSILEQGKMEKVNQLLGYDFFVEGIIRKGNQLGRTWGIPTINLLADERKLLPPNGVYFSEVVIDGKVWKGSTNIGYKPTIGKDYKKGIETFLYGCDEELYGRKARVLLKHFHRQEQRFGDRDTLIGQLKSDLKFGEEYFKV